MFDYEDLIMALSECRDGDVIEDSEEVISLYSLWNLIQNKIPELQHTLHDNTEMIDYANEMYKNVFNLDMFNTEAYENLDISIPFFKQLKFKSMSSAVCNAGDTGVIYLYPEGNKNKDKFVSIKKDFDYDEYYGDNVNKFLVYGVPGFNEYGLWPYLETIFYRLKKIAEIEKSIGYIPNKQVINTEYLNITMNYSLTDVVNPTIDIKFNENIDPRDSQYKKYVSFDTTIQDDIKKCQEDILKHIPVKVDDLNEFLKQLVKYNMGDILRGTVKVYDKK